MGQQRKAEDATDVQLHGPAYMENHAEAEGGLTRMQIGPR